MGPPPFQETVYEKPILKQLKWPWVHTSCDQIWDIKSLFLKQVLPKISNEQLLSNLKKSNTDFDTLPCSWNESVPQNPASETKPRRLEGSLENHPDGIREVPWRSKAHLSISGGTFETGPNTCANHIYFLKNHKGEAFRNSRLKIGILRACPTCLV